MTKTNLMIFHPMQKKINVNVPLVMENTVIKKVIETKFLAVIVDQHLSWKPNISSVPKQTSKTVGLLQKPAFIFHPKRC